MPAPLPPTFAMTRPSSTSGDPALPKKPFWRAEALPRVLAPDARALREIDRVQLTLGAEGVDDAVGDDRHRARALVEAEVVAIGGRIGVAPLLVAGACVERLDDLFVADTVEEDDAALRPRPDR